MRAYTFVERIDRPPQVVWDTLLDLSVASRWRPLTKKLETVDGQPVHAGSEVQVTIEFHGRVQKRISKTVVFEPGRRWVLRSSDNPSMEGLFGFTVEPDGEGTRVTATCDLTAHGLLSWLFLPLVARGERTRRLELLPNLKRLVESS
jgi:carbon monoxide dehydrogenase subunit G